MKIGIIGCGFWAGYQVAAWREADAALEFAFCDRDAAKAQALASRFGPARAYEEAREMLDQEMPDLVDIITSPEMHAALTELAAEKGIPVICQKPMAPDWDTARRMVSICREAGIPFYIHENFRWQLPMRKVKALLQDDRIGTPFRARMYFNSAFPVFENQPFLAELEKMMVADVGVHLLDVCRFLFGEVQSVYCLNQRINPKIRGEDVSTMLLQMKSGMSCTIEMSYASIVDYECFPQTLLEIEGTTGSIRLAKDLQVRVTHLSGQDELSMALLNYDWVHPQYAVVQSSMVAIHRHFLSALAGNIPVETSGEDNLKTLQLTYAAYESAETGKVVEIPALEIN
jgi:predicted dehydrogenase